MVCMILLINLLFINTINDWLVNHHNIYTKKWLNNPYRQFVEIQQGQPTSCCNAIQVKVAVWAACRVRPRELIQLNLKTILVLWTLQ